MGFLFVLYGVFAIPLRRQSGMKVQALFSRNWLYPRLSSSLLVPHALGWVLQLDRLNSDGHSTPM